MKNLIRYLKANAGITDEEAKVFVETVLEAMADELLLRKKTYISRWIKFRVRKDIKDSMNGDTVELGLRTLYQCMPSRTMLKYILPELSYSTLRDVREILK